MKKENAYRFSKERASTQSPESVDHFDEGADIFTSRNITPRVFDYLEADSYPISCLYGRNHSIPLEAESGSESEDMATLLTDKKEILTWAVALLARSPAAKTMLEEAKKEGWSISLEDLGGPDFHLDVPEKQIILDNQGFSENTLARSVYFRNIMLVSLIRALRDVWQEKRYGGFDENYAPETILTLERVRAADLDVLAVLVAWELRCEGHNGNGGELWRYMIGSEDGDIAMRFSGYLERDPSSNFTREALAAAFRQWFHNETRIDACDHETLNYLDSVIAGTHEANPFGCERVQAIDVERLSCLPDRSAYLQGKGRGILSDPLYAGMNDEINQAHLMHIVYDLQVTYAGNVPFRNAALAERIFPHGDIGTDLDFESENLWN